MKFLDYILLSHIAKKNSYYESQKRLEKEKLNAEERKQALKMMSASPIAAFFYFLSVAIFVICFKHRPVRWICTFTALYSMFTIITAFMLQQGERQRHLLLALSAFISTSGLFIFFNTKHLIFAIVLFFAGFLAMFFCISKNKQANPPVVPQDQPKATSEPFSSYSSASQSETESEGHTRNESPSESGSLDQQEDNNSGRFHES